MPPIRVLIADDHPMVRQGLSTQLASIPDVEVVAEVAGGREATAASLRDAVDVAFLDLRMPEGDGIAAARAIREARPSTRVILFTVEVDRDRVEAAIRAGADGYLLKEAGTPQLAEALARVLSGQRFIDPALVSILMDRAASAESEGRGGALSPRQREILLEVERKASDREIADRLGISPETVRTNLDRAFLRLGVATRAAAVAEARRRGLLAGA